MPQIVRTTLIGGVLFLIPLVFVAVVIEKAVNIIKLIPIESIAGVALEEILAVVIMVLCSLVAGLAARSPKGRVLHKKLDKA